MANYPKRAAAFFVVQALTFLSILPWIFLSFILCFAFDKPGLENDWRVLAFALPVWTYPLPMFICLGVGWIFFLRKKYTGALISSSIPLACAFLYIAGAGSFLYFHQLSLDNANPYYENVYSGLTAIPPKLFSKGNLEALNLSGNNFIEIPSDIKKLGNLRYLDFSGNRITEVSPETCELTELRQLCLSGNLISALPPELARLKKLEELELRNNKLKEVPPVIFQMENLKRLDISDNQITVLPAETGKLPGLKILIIGGNPIKTLPPEISRRPNLEIYK